MDDDQAEALAADLEDAADAYERRQFVEPRIFGDVHLELESPSKKLFIVTEQSGVNVVMCRWFAERAGFLPIKHGSFIVRGADLPAFARGVAAAVRSAMKNSRPITPSSGHGVPRGSVEPRRE
jgi:hypothetical protein